MVKQGGREVRDEAEFDPSRGVTHILEILDESGSMEPRKADVVGGHNAMLDEQRRGPDRATLTLVKFNMRTLVSFVTVPIERAPRLTLLAAAAVGGEVPYVPGGGTALFDAVAEGVAALDGQVGPEDRVLVLINTDGEENSSTRATREQVRVLIEARTATGRWTFAYMGVDVEKWAASLSLAAANTISWDPKNVRGNAVTMSDSMNAYRVSTFTQSRSFYRPSTTAPEKEG
jgi:hypothetical protein